MKNDINPVALHVDILGHLGVPAAGLVAEMNAGLQELFHRYDCHVFLFSFSNSVFTSEGFLPFTKLAPPIKSPPSCGMP